MTPRADSALQGHLHSHLPNRFAVLPTSARFGIDPVREGQGITIAILDSGFFPHPDLVQPVSRIKAYVDLSGEAAELDGSGSPSEQAWHGTQTACVAAGNGWLSDGLYRSLAPAAEVVLVKVGQGGRITDDALVRGLDWIRRRRRRLGIRVASLSCAGDVPTGASSSPVDLAAERAVRAGIVVVAAAGNGGRQGRWAVLPPASAPSVITVGGYDDQNQLSGRVRVPWHSSFGPNSLGMPKPEVVAPAAWVAAPILPGTPAEREAVALSELQVAPDYALPKLVEQHATELGWPAAAAQYTPDVIRREVERRLQQSRVVSAHYQNVDGTSFAAPVVASIVALLIEARPSLTPADVKRIMLGTADRIPGMSSREQGFGAVDARRALSRAEDAGSPYLPGHFQEVEGARGSATFHFHAPAATSVELCGSFTEWENSPVELVRDPAGVWTGRVDGLTSGRHPYKFRVDGTVWVADPAQSAEEDDGHGGTNSILVVRS